MRLLTLGLPLALLAAPARADRFHLGSASDSQKPVEGEPAFIDGVLLREHEGQYVIRVVGGEIWIDKTLVHRIDRDELTVAKVEEAEAGQKEKLAAANERRREQVAAAEASARRARTTAEASARRDESPSKQLTLDVDLEGLLPDYEFTPSSDVLRRLDLGKLSREIEDFLRKHGVEPRPDEGGRDFRIDIDFKGLLPRYGFMVYDPVIHRVDLVKLSRQVEDFLRAELRRAANRGDRRAQ